MSPSFFCGPTEVDGVHDPRPSLGGLNERSHCFRAGPKEWWKGFFGKVAEAHESSSKIRFGQRAKRGRIQEWDRGRPEAERKRGPKEQKGGKSQSSVAKPLPELFEKRREKEGEVTCQPRQNARKKNRLEKGGNKQKGRANPRHPSNGNWNRNGKEKYFLIRQGGGKSQKE